ncbi:hypothetical protein ACH5RR_039608 [Cinchona calisaya]|uniref:GTP-binding protein n=1 Tax=Cinchona calisaya TaxID=153742 RepID=A0ABD2Y3Y2_9GENT
MPTSPTLDQGDQGEREIEEVGGSGKIEIERDRGERLRWVERGKEVECGAPLSTRVLKGSNIVLSKYGASDAQVEYAEFIKTGDCPSDGLLNLVLLGGLMWGNLCFGIRWNAAAPQELRTDWDKFTKDYFLNRPNLVSVFLLIDANIPAKKIDLEDASWLGQNWIPMTLVFTKCDKWKKKKNGGKKPEENVQDFQYLIRNFFQNAPPWIMTGSVTNQGNALDDQILFEIIASLRTLQQLNVSS